VRVLLVAEGEGVFADALSEVRDGVWRVVDGFRERAGDNVVCAGVVADENDAAAALLSAVSGCGILVDARASRDVIDRLCSDLRTFGRIEHRLERRRRPALTVEQRELLALLADGLSLGDAAQRLHLSRRTADRRLAAARATLGASTTAEAVHAFAQLSA
jgi:DNA-binding NarL/FixJ family response regulator